MWASTKLTVIDIDECSTNNDGCAHNCTNTIGSYQCSCEDGYILNKDNHSCEGTYVCMYLCNSYIM